MIDFCPLTLSQGYLCCASQHNAMKVQNFSSLHCFIKLLLDTCHYFVLYLNVQTFISPRISKKLSIQSLDLLIYSQKDYSLNTK